MLRARRLGRGVPGGVPRADGHAAPAEAAGVLRPGRRGGADPARPDPGRLGAPLHPPAQRAGGVGARPPAAQERAGQDAGRAAVPGAAHADRGGRRRLLRRRRRRAAPRDGRQAVDGEDGAAARPVLRRDGGQRDHRRGGRRGSSRKMLAFANFGFPESHSISFASLVYYSAWFKLLLPGGVLRGAAQLPADGLLLAAVAGRRRPPARRARPRRRTSTSGRADAVLQPDPRSHRRAGHPARAGRGPRHRPGAGRGDRRRARAGRPVPRPRRSRPSRAAHRAAGRGAGHGGRVRLLRHRPPLGAVGGRGGRRRAARAAARHRRRAGRARRCPG